MIDQNVLSGFYGTEGYTRFGLFPKIVATDGVMYVAQNGGKNGAFWLLDAIASYQPKLLKHKDERLHYMQFWKLTVKDNTAVLTCEADDGEKPVVKQEIEYTDFDLPEIKIWVEVAGDLVVLLLPSEH